jgi:hypothetical protein
MWMAAVSAHKPLKSSRILWRTILAKASAIFFTFCAAS